MILISIIVCLILSIIAIIFLVKKDKKGSSSPPPSSPPPSSPPPSSPPPSSPPPSSPPPSSPPPSSPPPSSPPPSSPPPSLVPVPKKKDSYINGYNGYKNYKFDNNLQTSLIDGQINNKHPFDDSKSDNDNLKKCGDVCYEQTKYPCVGFTVTKDSSGQKFCSMYKKPSYMIGKKIHKLIYPADGTDTYIANSTPFTQAKFEKDKRYGNYGVVNGNTVDIGTPAIISGKQRSYLDINVPLTSKSDDDIPSLENCARLCSTQTNDQCKGFTLTKDKDNSIHCDMYSTIENFVYAGSDNKIYYNRS